MDTCTVVVRPIGPGFRCWGTRPDLIHEGLVYIVHLVHFVSGTRNVMYNDVSTTKNKLTSKERRKNKIIPGLL